MKKVVLTFLLVLVGVTSPAFGGVFKADCTGPMYSRFGVEVVNLFGVAQGIMSGGFSSVSMGYDLTKDFFVDKSIGDDGSPEYVFYNTFRSPGGEISFKLVGRVLTISSPNPHYDGLQLRCHRSDLGGHI